MKENKNIHVVTLLRRRVSLLCCWIISVESQQPKPRPRNDYLDYGSRVRFIAPEATNKRRYLDTAKSQIRSAVRLMIETDKRVTYQQIPTSLGITQVHKIVHECLTVKKLYTQSITCNLTDAQKLRRFNRCREMM
ncbi:hypothetical protein EVAR_45396_1 [Eumeta japonica]|uniref:Uncharacterized protein n=1 Tax=Eumeta variegata TaxID=151549 RepID=A0A4C1WRD6_EUMVA|nr:hypothetical protein EVAR_45396_1 [Eumeta japonica]